MKKNIILIILFIAAMAFSACSMFTLEASTELDATGQPRGVIKIKSRE